MFETVLCFQLNGNDEFRNYFKRVDKILFHYRIAISECIDVQFPSHLIG